VPLRGRKRGLVERATTNASEQLTRHRLHRATDLTSRARALEELQAALGLPEAPLRIECYDMSHLQGSDYVGSMVVMEDALPKRSDYRRFKVASVLGNDDFAAMEEVLRRRLGRLHQGADLPEDEPDEAPVEEAQVEEERAAEEEIGRRRRRASRFAYPPQLLLLDGGKGQLGVGVKVLADLGLTGTISVAALAKQFEEVYVPDQPEPVRIPRDTEAIYLLQQIRDEAHRFAIAFHRERRAKRMTRSVLDDVKGLGPVRRRRLIAELGGVRGVQGAPLERLLELSWLPEDVARAVYDRVHDHRPATPRALATLAEAQ
jgi:excinuclease ABC subunit C